MATDSRRSRRDFLKTLAITGAGATLAGCNAGGDASTAEPESPEAAPQGTPPEGTVFASSVPHRKLGATGLEVSILAIGGGQTFDPRYDRILHRGFRDGVNFLDTALLYSEGMSHRTLAPFVKQVGRENLVIVSKGHSGRATVSNFTRDLDKCVHQLETDYLDMYLMQAVDDPRYLDPEYIRMGESMRRSGRTRFFGFSTCGHGMIECMEKAARVGGIDAIMFRYSFARYGDLALNRAIDACRKAGIGLIAMKSQNCVPANHEQVKAFRSQQFTLAQAKLKAIWADERIDTVTSLMDNTRKLAENVAAAKSTVQISVAELQQLQRLATASAHLSCQGCGEICEPLCAGRVQIARPLRYLMYHECYGETARARDRYAALPTGARAIDGVDFSAAAAACPQGIDIAGRLNEARRALA
jgi:predicted aldo/keto reductase-like oxidoreductase